MFKNIAGLNQLPLKMRFMAIVAALVIGFAAFGICTFQAMITLNVNGPVYERIVQGKDIIADVLPPPEYIIESYMVALQLSQAVSPTETDALTAHFQTLKADYETRHRFWQDQHLEPELTVPLLERSYQAAQTFYHEAEQYFLPAIKTGQRDLATASLRNLRHAYEQHRLAIDDVVRYASSRNLADEAQAKTTIRHYSIGLIGIFVFSVALALALTLVISRGILRSINTAQQVADAIAVGDLSSTIETDQKNEIGALLLAMKTMQDSINAFVTAQGIMAQKHAEGWVKEQLDASRFPGTYGKMAQEVNDLIQSRIAINRRLIHIMTQYAKGNFSIDMDVLPGETIIITETMNNVKSTLLEINGEIKRLVEAGVKGDFSQRGNADRFEFMFKDILTNLNVLMETCDTGFNDVLRVSDALSKGDLTQTINRDYLGTFNQMKIGVNDTVTHLRSLVSEVQEASVIMDTAAKEIASGNNNLSQRAEQQAASLEQTASSMEELTCTVKQNADNARQAHQVADSARQLAEKGGSVVEAAIAAMREINDSSNRIAEIIGVIDEIAFQTNLLALNASVEAARAGEQGRGFSVVATEVRNLAQRSATAARQSREMIQTSIQKVRAGSAFVNETGDALSEIVNSVKQVSDIVAGISTASTEQSAGIEQVNQAVAQMDDITQQNAALAEQVSAASISMSEQSTAMTHLLAMFNVAHAETATARRPIDNPGIQASAFIKAMTSQPVSAASAVHDHEWEEF
jgi:methyl-accepting chemotaxis protein